MKPPHSQAAWRSPQDRSGRDAASTTPSFPKLQLPLRSEATWTTTSLDG
ncbi:MAG: hypothetical protein WCP06_10510 [Verrucomicrobiota bacterium]